MHIWSIVRFTWNMKNVIHVCCSSCEHIIFQGMKHSQGFQKKWCPTQVIGYFDHLRRVLLVFHSRSWCCGLRTKNTARIKWQFLLGKVKDKYLVFGHWPLSSTTIVTCQLSGPSTAFDDERKPFAFSHGKSVRSFVLATFSKTNVPATDEKTNDSRF